MQVITYTSDKNFKKVIKVRITNLTFSRFSVIIKKNQFLIKLKTVKEVIDQVCNSK